MAVTIEALVKLDTKEAIAARATVADLEAALRKIAEKKYSAKMEVAGADIAAKNLAYLTSSAAKFDAEIKAAEKSAKAFSAALKSQMEAAQSDQKAHSGLASSMNGVDRAIQEAEAASKAFSAALQKQMQDEEDARTATDGLLSSMNAYDQAIYLNEQRSKAFSAALQKQMEEEQENARAAEENTRAHTALEVALGNIAARAFHLVISKITQALREAVSTMKDVDTQLTNISKVSGITGQALADMGERAYETASKYGVAADEYLSAVYTFQKAGLNDSAEQMGELAVKTMLVGDTTADVASKFLISANAAWKLGGDMERLNQIVDEADYINNNYATDLGKLSEGLPRVASVAAQAGMSAEETLAAIGTITAVTQESGTKSATALRALILNIEGQVGEFVDDTGETFKVTEESVKSMQGLMEKYAKAELDAARASGELINPMTAIKAIFEGMANSDLNNQELFALLSGMGGKLRTNQLTALVQNYELFGEMLDKIADSAGTADSEISLMMDSWERKTQVLKNTWTEFVANIVSTDAIKGGIEDLTRFIDLLNDKFNATKETQKEINSLQSEYDGLVAKGADLTAAEKTRLEYLEKQLEVLKLQEEYEAKVAARKLQDKLTGNRQDERSLTLYQRDTEGIQYTGDLNAYREALQDLNGEWAKYYSNILSVKEAGEQLTESQEEFIRLYKDNNVAATAASEQEELVNGYHVLVDAQGQIVAYEKDHTDELEAQAQKWEEAKKKQDEVKTGVELVDTAVEEATLQGEAFAATFKTAADNIGKVQMALDGLNFPTFGFASGTKNAPGGPTLVNELGPELISENGRAYIANGGAPAVVNLSRGAIVLTADETKTALKGGMPIHAAVKGAGAAGVADTGVLDALTDAINKLNQGLSPTGKFHTRDEYIGEGSVTFKNKKGEPAGGKGSGGKSGGESSAPAKTLEELEKEFSDFISNLDKQAKLANNRGELSKEAELYEKAQKAIEDLAEEYRSAGYAEDSNEILDLLNKHYDYQNKIDKVKKNEEEAAQKNLTDAASSLKETLTNLDKQAQLAKNQGDAEKEAQLYEQAQEALQGMVDQYRSAGFSDVSNEVIDLLNQQYSYQERIDRINQDAIAASEAAIKEAAENVNKATGNLDKQALLARNRNDYAKEIELYQQANQTLQSLIDEYREAGYADDSDEIVDLLNRQFDYQAKIDGAEKAAEEAQGAALKEAAENTKSLLTNLNKQASLARTRGEYAAEAQFYEQAQEAIKGLVEQYREAGYADSSDEILDLLSMNYDYAGKQLELYQSKWDELIDALNADASAQEMANKLEEKRLAVEEAREALANAQNQRTTRVYNAATGQWEWVADQSKITSAQKSLDSAEKNYAEEVKSQALSELKSMRDTVVDLNDVILGPALSAVVTMAQDSVEFQNFARALNAVFGVGTFLNSTEGNPNTLPTTDSHDTVYSFGNVTLTADQAANMTVAELAQMLSVLKLTS